MRFGSKCLRALLVSGVLLAGLSLADGALAYTHRTLHVFCSEKRCADGIAPHDLAMDQSGNLYGTTEFGGAHHSGAVFQFVPATGAYNVLYNFCPHEGCGDGKWPFRVKLVIDTAGNLYGTAAQGGNSHDDGVVFKLTHSEKGWKERVLYTFCSEPDCIDGGIPATGLTYVGEGSGALYDGVSPLYGTTEFEGAHDRGVVFELTPATFGSTQRTEKVLYTFCPDEDRCKDGIFPRSPLYADGAGNLFGTTEIGGKSGLGVVYELSPTGKKFKYSVIHSFCAEKNCADGAEPFSNVVMDDAGNIFGTTTGGGFLGGGVIFKLAPPAGADWQYSVLAKFDHNTGERPVGLTLGPGGALFGATSSGGANFAGTVFKFDGTLAPIYTFCSEPRCTDGKSPLNGLIEDSAGNLFGTAEDRGHKHAGTLFELSP
jgi:uncharacterized repeat protein (TIGR03803 family)